MFRRRRPPSEPGLHQCPLCHDDSVVPVLAEPLDLARWDLRLRCGQCGTYDLDLSRGMTEIGAALERQDRERMTSEAAVFIAALEHDLIDAGDLGSTSTKGPP